MCNVHMRPEVVDVMGWQMACASCDGVQTDEFRTGCYEQGLSAVSDPEVGQAGKHAFLFSPIANTFTLGFYGQGRY
jgi:hypothetical protein